MKSEDIQQHRLLVLNYINGLFSRHEYFLNKIIDCCIRQKNMWGAQHDDITSSINHYFDAYLNTFQTLKDSLEIAFARDISWSEFKEIPYSKFIQLSRNASTHDGFSIINMVVDGKFYVSSDITRVSKVRNDYKLVKIETPTEDILTVCVRFSHGLFMKIKDWLETESTNLPNFSPVDYFQKFNPQSIKVGMPDDIKQLFITKKSELVEAVKQNQEAFINHQESKKFSTIQSILDLCNLHLNAT